MSTIENCDQHHVKFKLDKEEVKTHHESLEITRIDEHLFSVNLGYLKIDHFYKITFELDYVGDEFIYLTDKSSKYIDYKEMQRKSHDDHKCLLTFVCYTHKEKSDKEHVYFEVVKCLPDGAKQTVVLSILFEAKVLGAHQGTPLLRNGIAILSNASLNPELNHFNVI